MLRNSKRFVLCYKKSRLPNNLCILPALIGFPVYCYNGRSYDRFLLSSLFMCFFFINEFFSTKRIGPIHPKKADNRKKKK